MLPQLGAGGGTPMPRNDSAASSSSTLPMPRAAETMIGAAALGRTWRKITRAPPPPPPGTEPPSPQHRERASHPRAPPAGRRPEGGALQEEDDVAGRGEP